MLNLEEYRTRFKEFSASIEALNGDYYGPVYNQVMVMGAQFYNQMKLDLFSEAKNVEGIEANFYFDVLDMFDRVGTLLNALHCGMLFQRRKLFLRQALEKLNECDSTTEQV